MAGTYARVNGAWVSIVGPPPVDPGPGPGPGGPFPKPTVDNTGPRVAITGATLDGNAAINAAIANGGVLTGRRIANVALSQPSHADLIFRDCEVTGAWFGVEAWNGFGTPPSDPSRRTTFEYCAIRDVHGNAGIAGRNWVAKYCEFTHNGDDMKPSSNVEVFASLLHDLWSEGDDPHGDNIQCFGGDDILFHWNTMISLNAPDAPTFAGGVGSSVLQMSDGGDATNIRFLDNWVNGGAYTLRGADSWAGNVADLVFRRNKHGRDFGYGPITGMGSYNGGTAVSDYDSSNVWEDDGTPVA
ncbi:hypothetical protein [Jiangella anatolica]|uniref:Pectate lyase n=1 Tax=Jiangella anatolica TaxID=2670374 RepID=A0A2W2CER4_9ACTN|nr:hypothetical protein [Jiangella anatolica]PZF84156.1 hypothetical protein C1I92_09915 [Jiangella anatolica]